MGSGSSVRIRALDSNETTSADCESSVASIETYETTLPGTGSSHSSFVTPLQILPGTQTNNKSSTDMTKIENLSVTQTHLEMKIAQLEQELGSSESEKLDLLDQIQALEERLKELTDIAADSREDPEVPEHAQLSETLRAKDHFIQQLEQQVASLQTNFNKMRARMRNKIRSLTNRLCEAKQESSISKLELRESNAELKEELKHCHGDFASASPAAEVGTGSRTTIILELSAQVSEQAAMIAELEDKLKLRDKELQHLRLEKQKSALTSAAADGTAKRGHGGGDEFQTQAAARMGRGGIPLPDPRGASRARPSSGSSSNSAKPAVWRKSLSESVAATPGHGGLPTTNSEGSDTNLPTLQRQSSSALSDSDSDWEVEMPTAKIHSAPPRFPSKSPSIDDGLNTNNNNNNYYDSWSSDGSRPGPLSADDGGAVQSRPASASHSRQKRRSVLKGRLEKQNIVKGNAQTRSGPSLAFVHSPGEDQDGSSDKAVSDHLPHTTASGLHVPSTVARPLAV